MNLTTDVSKDTLFLSRWNDDAVAEITCHDQGVFFKKHEQGIDFDLVLERRPATNVFSYRVKSKNLAWHYQPALTRAEIKQGCARPENVVGSYAVYHQTKKNGIYETGKAFHVLRPCAMDRNGIKSWAQLKYRNGCLNVIVDPVFLRQAAYPVIVDPTFGHSSVGASSFSSGSAYMIINPLLALSEEGTLTEMSVYAVFESASAIQLGVYDSSGNHVAHTGAITVPSVAAWASGNLLTNPTKSAGNYYLAFQTNVDNVRVYYDTAAAAESYQVCVYGTWPATLSRIEYSNWVFSIYVTYTVSGGIVSGSGNIISAETLGNSGMMRGTIQSEA